MWLGKAAHPPVHTPSPLSTQECPGLKTGPSGLQWTRGLIPLRMGAEGSGHRSRCWCDRVSGHGHPSREPWEMTFIWPQREREVEGSGELGTVRQSRHHSQHPGHAHASSAFPGRSTEPRSPRLGAFPVTRRPSAPPGRSACLPECLVHAFCCWGENTPPKTGLRGNVPRDGSKPVTAVPRSLQTSPDEPPCADQGQNYFFYLPLGSEQMSCYKGKTRGRQGSCRLPTSRNFSTSHQDMIPGSHCVTSHVTSVGTQLHDETGSQKARPVMTVINMGGDRSAK